MPRKKQPLIGNGMNANLLKEFIDLSYKGNTSIAPEGYDIDSPLSDSRVKVYAKKGSNDKDIVITHRGSVGLDDWMDNASYLFRGKVKGTKTYNLHRERHKRAVEKYGAKNITAIGHSRAGLYLQELQKEFPIKENITYNKASGFYDIGRKNDENQTDIRVGNDIVSLLAPLQNRPNDIVKIDGTKNPFDFNTAHQTSEIDKLGTTFVGKKNMEGEGITPRISSEHRIRKLLGVEQRRLERMRNGTTKYKSKYITESKTLEKISRLKKRLASAEANEGQAAETFFIPKTEKWLKINKNDTYLNTPLKEDGKHRQMVSEIDRTIAELKAKKKKQPPKENETIKIAITEKKAEEIKEAVKEEVKKAEEAVKVETKKVKIKDLTKEEQLARKKEYDRLRYLKIKAKALEAQATNTETPKQVEKLEENVEGFKEEVKELVADVKEEVKPPEKKKVGRPPKKVINILPKQPHEEVEVIKVKCKNVFAQLYLTLKNAAFIHPETKKVVGYLHEDGKIYNAEKYPYKIFNGEEVFDTYTGAKSGDLVVVSLRRPFVAFKFEGNIKYSPSSRRHLTFLGIFNKKDGGGSIDSDAEYSDYVEEISIPEETYEEAMKKYNEEEEIKKRQEKTGKGFNLEETAYGGNYDTHSYLDTIIDNDTTPQNLLIHSFKSKPKYIQSLAD